MDFGVGGDVTYGVNVIGDVINNKCNVDGGGEFNQTTNGTLCLDLGRGSSTSRALRRAIKMMVPRRHVMCADPLAIHEARFVLPNWRQLYFQNNCRRPIEIVMKAKL